MSIKDKLKKLRFLLWSLVAMLLWWSVRQIPLNDILDVLRQILGWQILALLVVNVGVVLLLGGRWWLILRAYGHRLPFWVVMRYRLAAFGVSYFTPGPQFGGEPLQVHYLRHNHQIPGTEAAATITVDKIIELLTNFGFLIFGILMLTTLETTAQIQSSRLVIAVSGPALLPAVYLGQLWMGKQPIAGVLRLLPVRWKDRPWLANAIELVEITEVQVTALCRQKPRLIFGLLFYSGVLWAVLGFEYWLALRFLGGVLNFRQLVSVMVMARLAFLTPMPGGLGALEAGQVLAMQILGLNPALGVGISLLIRARDVLFGSLGLWWGGLRQR
ncbi:MAG: flippase-like domain-containing protein [Anaerolineales bacterium]|nr:flippase-like domain-containing protein [Anaerolineales bacterium]